MPAPRFTARFSAIATVSVLALSLLLLAYVGYGEARRTYPGFELEKLAADGNLIQTRLNSFLLANLPLAQFPGFDTLTQPLLDSDASIANIYVTDQNNTVVFANNRRGAPNLPGSDFTLMPDANGNSAYIQEQNQLYDRVSLPLSDKFGQSGELRLTVARSTLTGTIDGFFTFVLFALALITAIFTLFIAWRHGRRIDDERSLNLGFGLGFLAMAVAVLGTLVALYTGAIQNEAKALGASLAYRLNTPAELGLDLASFNGLGDVLTAYQKANPNLSYVALTNADRVMISADQKLVGTAWRDHPDQFEYAAPLSQSSANSQLTVRVGMPISLILDQLWRSGKNFLALFLAAALLSSVFFSLIRAFHKSGAATNRSLAVQELRLAVVVPLYFVGVFADALVNSFRPQYFHDLAVAQGFDTQLVSALFTVYFLAYALALLPAGRFVDRFGLKPLFTLGAATVSGGLLLMALTPSFPLMFLAQALTGLGQGTLFIAAQSYALAVVPPGQRTRGSAVIVFGYSGGALAGLAIGSLLASDPTIGRNGVLLVGAVVALLALVYTHFVMPSDRFNSEAASAAQSDAPSTASGAGFIASLKRKFADGEFMNATLFIGIPAKIIMAGLISATLPLLLARQHYATEDIGQILMLYSGGMLLASRLVVRGQQETHNPVVLLVVAAAASGIGLLMAGLSTSGGLFSGDLALLSTIVLLIGVAVMGIANGFVQALIITYIASTRLATTTGRNSAISLYRLFERGGNVAGPLVVGQVAFLAGGGMLALAWLGGAVMALGLLFALLSARSKAAQPTLQEVVR